MNFCDQVRAGDQLCDRGQGDCDGDDDCLDVGYDSHIGLFLTDKHKLWNTVPHPPILTNQRAAFI